MGVRLLSLLVCALLVHSAHAAVSLPCPFTKCGEVYQGLFDDLSDPFDPTGIPGYLKEYYFTPGRDFSQYYGNLNDPLILDGPGDCKKQCEFYNSQAQGSGNPLATYWMFEDTCTDGWGGICYCFSNTTCQSSVYSDEALRDATLGYYASPAANYTVGSICHGDVHGDPHFTGADGSHFDFTGVPNQSFAAISDAHLQVNMFLGGRYGKWEGKTKALTWIREIGILWGHHNVLLKARRGASAAYQNGYLDSVLVDGEPLAVNPHSTASALDGALTVSWSGVKVRSGNDDTDVIYVALGDVLVMKLTLRPEVKVLRTSDDGVVHFGMEVVQAKLSSNVHGVLGQTFRPDFSGRLAKQRLVHSKVLGVDVVAGDNAEGFVDGGIKDYLVPDVLKASCAFCRFARATAVDDETAEAMSTAAYVSSSYSVLGSRSYLSATL